MIADKRKKKEKTGREKGIIGGKKKERGKRYKNAFFRLESEKKSRMDIGDTAKDAYLF